jgi:hypothetical protein
MSEQMSESTSPMTGDERADLLQNCQWVCDIFADTREVTQHSLQDGLESCDAAMGILQAYQRIREGDMPDHGQTIEDIRAYRDMISKCDTALGRLDYLLRLFEKEH